MTHFGIIKPTPSRVFFYIVAAQIAVALASITWFCRRFQLDPRLILVHMPLVAALVTTSYGPARLAVACGRLRLARALAIVAPVGVTSALAVLYFMDFSSNRLMATNLTHTTIRSFVADGWAGGNEVSLPRAIYAAIGVALALVVAFHTAMSARVVGALNSMQVSRRLMAKRRVVWVPALTVFAVLAARELARRTPASELLTHDPVLALMRSSTDIVDERYLAFTAALRPSELAARAAYPRGREFDRKNVIVITVDSLRADHMSLYGYARPTTPFLQSLEAGGHLRKVEFATSTCSETACGILSTLNSKTLRSQIRDNFKLQDLLRDQGYKTYFLLSGNHDYKNLSTMYGSELSLYVSGDRATRYTMFDDRLVLDGLEHVPDRAGPAFLYLHLMSPHLFGFKQDQYRVYQPSAVSQQWSVLLAGTPDQQSIINNYDNGVGQADALIRDLFAVLDRKGYLDNSVVVILGDHGEGLGERASDSYSHLLWLYQEFIRIPMLIYDTSPVTYANLRFATQIDVAPTIVDRLGLPVPASWEGRSLLDGRVRNWSVHQTSLVTPAYAFIYREDPRTYKYIYYSVGRMEQLFELTTDPAESANLIDTAEPALLARFRGARDRALAQ